MPVQSPKRTKPRNKIMRGAIRVNIVFTIMSLVMLFLLPFVVAATPSFSIQNSSSKNDNFDKLNTFLSKLEIEISHALFSIDFNGSPITIELHNLFCRKLSVGNVIVTPKRNIKNPIVSTLSFNLQGVQIKCNGNYTFTIDGSEDVGHMETNSTYSNINLEADLIVDRKNHNTKAMQTAKLLSMCPPNLLNISVCNSHIKIDLLKFSGNLNYLADFLKSKINGMVNPAICNELMLLSKNITSILQNISNIITNTGNENKVRTNWKNNEDEILKRKQLLPNNNNNIILSNLQKNLFIKVIHNIINMFLDAKACK